MKYEFCMYELWKLYMLSLSYVEMSNNINNKKNLNILYLDFFKKGNKNTSFILLFPIKQDYI